MNKAKSILVILAGTQDEFPLKIMPGTTARDVLQKIGITGVLRKATEAMPFGEHEVVYDLVENGAKLIAAPTTDVALQW